MYKVSRMAQSQSPDRELSSSDNVDGVSRRLELLQKRLEIELKVILPVCLDVCAVGIW